MGWSCHALKHDPGNFDETRDERRPRVIRRWSGTLAAPTLVASSLLAGYAIGTATILAWLDSRFDSSESLSEPIELFAADMLFWRYKFEGFDQRYSDTVHYSITASVLFVLFLVFGLRFIARTDSMWFVPVVVRKADRFGRVRKKRVWRGAIQSTRHSPSLNWLVTLFLISMIGAWICFAADSLVMEVRRQLWMRSPAQNPWFNPTPIPVVGWFTWADVVWITALTLVAGFYLVVREARSRVDRSPFIRKRWCRWCAYPLTGTSAAVPTGSSCGRPHPTCPECGANPLE